MFFYFLFKIETVEKILNSTVDGCTNIPVCSLQVWRQKAQYLQHKQNKAEATTVKHKSVSETKSKGVRDCKRSDIYHFFHFVRFM